MFCSSALSWASRTSVFLLGKEETKLKAQQEGVHTLVAACLSEKVRSKTDPNLEWSTENGSGGVSPVVVQKFGVTSPHVLVFLPRTCLCEKGTTEAHWKLGWCFEWKAEECNVLF